MMPHRAEVSYIKGMYQESILAKPNVVGVGVGYKVRGQESTDELCVVALVRKKIPVAGLVPDAIIPKSLDGVETDVIQVGDLRALQAPTDRWRPIPGGVSIGHYKVTAGTLGVVVRDRASGDRLILSNNHVMANSNDAQQGDPILQPGSADGGRSDDDTVAVLERFEPILFSSSDSTCDIANSTAGVANFVARLLGSSHRLTAFQENPTAVNEVDAALARPLSEIELLDEIVDIGVVGGTTPPRLGMTVRKSGRTTGFTTGQINVLEATVTVGYGSQTARFEGQIVSSAMSAPGDSGSLLVDADALLAVGLLFAGSDQSTIYNPIQTVLDKLRVVL
jgi:hypothetical protein